MNYRNYMITYNIRNDPKNPVLITVPHAGCFYPELFKKYIKLDLDKIRKIEDYQSDKILKLIKKENIDFLIAKCSRAVVDLNRSRKSIDNDMFNGIAIIGQPDEKKMLSYGLGVFPKIISNKSILEVLLSASNSLNISLVASSAGDWISKYLIENLSNKNFKYT